MGSSVMAILRKCVSLSTTYAKYIAPIEACKEVMWMENFLQVLGMKQEKYNPLCDNQIDIHLAKNPSFHSRTKHMDVMYHWIREVVSSKLLKLEKIHADKNGSDMMTKILPSEKVNSYILQGSGPGAVPPT
jgi:hypothetical protein